MRFHACLLYTSKQVATQTSRNGNEQFVILFDVAEGEQKDFYQKLYNADKAQNLSLIHI